MKVIQDFLNWSIQFVVKWVIILNFSVNQLFYHMVAVNVLTLNTAHSRALR